MKRLVHACVHFLLACGLVATAIAAQAQGQADPDSLKVAYLYNFTRYAQWPAAGVATAPFVVCVLDDGVLGGKLLEIHGRKAGPRGIEVREATDAAAWRQCQILFVEQAQSRRLVEVQRALRGHPVLLVSDGVDAARQGAAIELIESGERIRMVINRQAAELSGISLSAQLLRLALAVH